MAQGEDSSRRRPPGDGSVYFVASRNRWCAQLDLGNKPTGGRARITRYAMTEREATKLLRLLQREQAQAADLTAARMTVAELVTKWLTDVAPLSQSAKTQSVSEGLSRCHVLPAIGAMKVTEVTPDHVERALKDWIDKGLSRSTIMKCRNILTAAFRYAESRRIVSWNPAKLANLPPASATREPQERTVLDAQQFAALIAAAHDSRLALFITILGTYGLRPGELAGLRWANVDLDNERIYIEESLHWGPGGPTLGQPKTGRSRRPIQISPSDTQALRNHRVNQASERDFHGDWPSEWAGLVFTTASGLPIDDHNLRRDVRKLGRRIGVANLTPYGLRGTATSIAADSGVPIEELADLLGHVDTTMVMRHYRKPLRKAFNAGLTVAHLREAGGAASGGQ